MANPTFSVKGWEKHQHYKDRNPPWIRFYNTTLDDYDVAHLPDAAKAHLFGIWLLASRYENKIPYDAEFVAKKINATEAVNLEHLASMGLIIVDGVASAPLAERKQLDAPEQSRAEAEQRQTPKAPKGAVYPQAFEAFWTLYPNKVGKDAALKAWQKRQKAGDLPSHENLAEAIGRYIDAKPADREYCNPSTWLNQGRWQDALAKPTVAPAGVTPAPIRRTEEEWRSALGRFKRDEYWPLSGYGPQPGYGGCIVPASILAEFGLLKGAA